jgi:hypothetical protein
MRYLRLKAPTAAHFYILEVGIYPTIVPQAKFLSAV